MIKRILLLGLLLMTGHYWCWGQQIFTDLPGLLHYAQQKSSKVRSGQIRLDQAKLTKVAAILGVPDPSGSLSFSYTNNTRLPVNLFPAEIFGGPKGTFQEIQTGVQYLSNQNFYAEIKLFNLEGWEKLKQSKLSMQSTLADNQLQLKNLFDNIAALYSNIANLSAQYQATQQHLAIADTLRQLTHQKWEQGLAKPQDLNETEVNYLNTQASLQQLQFLLQQQHLALKVLCDIPLQDSLLVQPVVPLENLAPNPEVNLNLLASQRVEWQEKQAWSSFRSTLFAQLPTVSLFFSSTRQQFNTRARLFDQDQRWIPSSYLGVRLAVPIPSAQSVAQVGKARYDYALAQEQANQTRIQARLQQQQLVTEYQQALVQLKSNEAILRLHQDTYVKNRLNYNAGITSLEPTLRSYQAMVNSASNRINAAVSVLQAQSKIYINNTLK
ncbi:TolC family protein [Haliscomenobacter sp.]|uniref:TolC family protein n=1 Tax=Haliscomenobacter sp. TaxID=2717303 RepID=UPI003BAA8CA7